MNAKYHGNKIFKECWTEHDCRLESIQVLMKPTSEHTIVVHKVGILIPISPTRLESTLKRHRGRESI